MPQHAEHPRFHSPNPQPAADTTPPSFFASLATRTRLGWQQTRREGGVLHSVWSDVRHAPRAGWDMANWLKAILLLTGAAIALILVNAAFTTITHWINHLLLAAPTVDIGTDTSSGIWGVIDQPIRTYIANRSAGMAISGSTIYTLWQTAGLYGLLAGFAGSTIGRLLWTAWGAASAAAIWAKRAELHQMSAGPTSPSTRTPCSCRRRWLVSWNSRSPQAGRAPPWGRLPPASIPDSYYPASPPAAHAAQRRCRDNS
ncbi:hypothetical protein ACWGNN_42075 [Streptomyces sp. NPDC055817]